MLKELLSNAIINIEGSLFYGVSVSRYHPGEENWCMYVAEFLDSARNIKANEMLHHQQLDIHHAFNAKIVNASIYACYNPLVLLLIDRSRSYNLMFILMPVNMTVEQFTIFLLSYLDCQTVSSLNLEYYYPVEKKMSANNYEKYLDLHEEINFTYIPVDIHCALYKPKRELVGSIRREIFLFAPFIKSRNVLQRLIKFSEQMKKSSSVKEVIDQGRDWLLNLRYDVILYNHDGAILEIYGDNRRRKIELLQHNDGNIYLIKRLD